MQIENKKKDNYFKISVYQTLSKRIFDLILVIPAIIILVPIGLIIGFLIKKDSQGSVIYKQKRVGIKGKDFYIYKFRTMVSDADKIGPTSTQIGDNRVTKIGKILRKLSLDELPQLLNVLLGQMSMVGYRPGVRADYTIKELEEGSLFTVKPGITGYAQVNGRSGLSIEEKRLWEKKYIQDISLFVDIKIIIKTVGVVLRSKHIT